MKVLILDSGVLINLSLNGLLYIIPELKKISQIKFLITPDVKYETIDRPLGVPRFELGAISIEEMLLGKFIELPESLGISLPELNKKRDELMRIANHSLFSEGKWLQIVSNAEISCLAASFLLTQNKTENLIGIDERTTRLLAERPENLAELMSAKLHEKIKLDKSELGAFKDFRFIRSSELVYVAFKKGILKLHDPKTLEAALFATKYHGSSVSFEEIRELKRL